MKTVSLKIAGMHCAACSTGLERSLKKVPGVELAQVNLASNTARVRYDETVVGMEQLEAAVNRMSFSVVHEEAGEISVDAQEQMELSSKKKRLVMACCFLLLLLYVAMVPMLPGSVLPVFIDPAEQPLNFALVQLLLVIPILIAGRSFFRDGIITLKNAMPTMDTLVALGTGSAFLYSCYALSRIAVGDMRWVHQLYFESAGSIISFVLIGKTLELYSKGKAGNAIKALAKLTPPVGVLLRDGVETEVDVADIMVGDELVVKPGAVVPVDGVIVFGRSSLNEAMLTGESMPVTKSIGERVYGGTLLVDGQLRFKADKVGEDTVLAGIARMVEEAQGSKAPIARLADKLAGVFVPVVLIIAFISAVAWFVALRDVGFALRIFVAVLVIACPCALGLATPVAIMVAVGKGAELGILYRDAAALELAGESKIIFFDKTGTVTLGKPAVTDIVPLNTSREELLQWAASVESASSHPLAEAILEAARTEGVEQLPVSQAHTEVGGGMEARIGEHLVRLGKQAYLGVPITEELLQQAQTWGAEGKTTVFVAREGLLVGALVIADVLRPQSSATMTELRAMGIKTIILTGDNRAAAQAIASQVGVDEAEAEVLPEHKVDAIKRAQEKGQKVMMVGDGINDAPALAQADLGIAVGSGTGVALASADVVLVKDDLLKVVAAVRLSRATMKNIKENLAWAFAYNLVGIPVAAGVLYVFGGPLLNPMFAAAAMSLSSVSVVTNALRLNKFK